MNKVLLNELLSVQFYGYTKIMSHIATPKNRPILSWSFYHVVWSFILTQEKETFPRSGSVRWNPKYRQK